MTDIPGDFSPISQESVLFNNPVAQATFESLGGAINGILTVLVPVGTVVDSMLTEVQFQAQLGNPSPVTWVLADGRDVTGSAYETIVGSSVIPDLRGTYTRGKDNGRGLDPHGDLPLGDFETDEFGSHNHNFSDPGHTHATNATQVITGGGTPAGVITNGYTFATIFSSPTHINFVAQGGPETNPKSVIVNKMIRIN